MSASLRIPAHDYDRVHRLFRTLLHRFPGSPSAPRSATGVVTACVRHGLSLLAQQIRTTDGLVHIQDRLTEMRLAGLQSVGVHYTTSLEAEILAPHCYPWTDAMGRARRVTGYTVQRWALSAGLEAFERALGLLGKPITRDAAGFVVAG